MTLMPTLVFDCDGVLADTERDGHLVAFNRMFSEFDLPVRWDDVEYAEKLRIGGGKERLRSLLTADFMSEAGLPNDQAVLDSEVRRWHARKTQIYTELITSGAVPPRPGVRRLASEALEAGWRVGIASTSAEASVRAVLEHVMGLELARSIRVFAGDIVPAKKPAPDIYLAAVAGLEGSASSTVAIEDSRIGLLSATRAGLLCLVTPSYYTSGEQFDEAALVVTGLGDPDGEGTQVLSDPTGALPTGPIDLLVLESILSRATPMGGQR